MDYTFRCEKCRKKLAISHGISKPHPKVHQGCGGKLTHIIDTQDVIYKGAGFYTVDKRFDKTVDDV